MVEAIDTRACSAACAVALRAELMSGRLPLKGVQPGESRSALGLALALVRQREDDMAAVVAGGLYEPPADQPAATAAVARCIAITGHATPGIPASFVMNRYASAGRARAGRRRSGSRAAATARRHARRVPQVGGHITRDAVAVRRTVEHLGEPVARLALLCSQPLLGQMLAAGQGRAHLLQRLVRRALSVATDGGVVRCGTGRRERRGVAEGAAHERDHALRHSVRSVCGQASEILAATGTAVRRPPCRRLRATALQRLDPPRRASLCRRAARGSAGAVHGVHRGAARDNGQRTLAHRRRVGVAGEHPGDPQAATPPRWSSPVCWAGWRATRS